jgi:Zn-dependent metalloprotease
MRRVLAAAGLSLWVGCAGQEVFVEAPGTDVLQSVPGDIQQALRALPRAEVVAVHPGGVPAFVRGELAAGRVAGAGGLEAALQKLAPVFRLAPGELEARGEETDALGARHVRFQQRRHGLPVVGGELVVHVDAGGTVYAVNGSARAEPVSDVPAVDAAWAAQAVRALPAYDGFTVSGAERTFVLSTVDHALHLAWALEAAGTRDGAPARDTVYVDAHTGQLAEVRPHVHAALRRRVYSAGGSTSLPGALKVSEGGAPGADAQVRAAYENTGATYNFYRSTFGRDSWDGAGAALVSTVHYGQGYANAYWDGTQMVFGDGDGEELGPLALALDITAHELTHAVTDATAGLVYQNEPGALNEAMSDIFAAAAESWARGGVVDARTWTVGEEVYTPGTAGDALRYMASPTADGMSRDYYPQRYTGGQDHGGVHLNSGIANLAFQLLVAGGQHPRGATQVQVVGVGMAKAQAIFYRALTAYLVSTSTFAAARVATRQAAQDLYGAEAALSVEQAWAAVGVGAPPTGAVTPPPSPSQTAPTPVPAPSSGALRKGVPVTGLGGPAGAYTVFPVTVPAGIRGLSFRMSGGAGDADLYVRHGAKPTTSRWDYRPYLEGNQESVTAQPVTGTWYVMVRGYSAFSGVSLVVDWTM